MAAGLGIAAGGCRSVGRLFDFTDGAPMHGFAAPKLPTIRVGVVGMGGRGKHFLKRAQLIPGIVVRRGVEGALRGSERGRGVQHDAVVAPRACPARGDARRQARVHRSAERVHGRRVLGACRDEREDASPLHAARELLLRRGGDADLQPGETRDAGQAYARRRRVHPRPARHVAVRMAGKRMLAVRREPRSRRQPLSDARTA